VVLVPRFHLPARTGGAGCLDVSAQALRIVFPGVQETQPSGVPKPRDCQRLAQSEQYVHVGLPQIHKPVNRIYGDIVTENGDRYVTLRNRYKQMGSI